MHKDPIGASANGRAQATTPHTPSRAGDARSDLLNSVRLLGRSASMTQKGRSAIRSCAREWRSRRPERSR